MTHHAETEDRHRNDGTKERVFEMTILGRLLEHLGVQMYKRRDVAVAELVANCWDAGAKKVQVKVPESGAYDRKNSEIIIRDNGRGMSPEDVESKYLVVGRNRRKDENSSEANGRKVMGRKGIGKLAGFGIASKMEVISWRDGDSTRLTLDINNLKARDNTSRNAEIEGEVGPIPDELASFSGSGTQIRLFDLKHTTPIKEDVLLRAIGRRYSRSIRGRMKVYINESIVEDPPFDFEIRSPEKEGKYKTKKLDSGEEVKYFYGFTEDPIKSKELRGFTIMVRGKTAQAPPFFFDVEATASGQHGTKYLTGEIHADFLDEGTEDEDLIATDRQEIDWENEKISELKEFGDKLTRKALRRRSKDRGERMEETILDLDEFSSRIDSLAPSARKNVKSFLRKLGKAETDREGAKKLADSLVRAFEYRHFHDVVGDIEGVSDDPESLQLLLEKLRDWKVLESRAILEVVNGRLEIVEKFGKMVLNDAAETAGRKGDDNMHDLIASYPWLLNPDWQVLSEETTLSNQLEEWDYSDTSGESDQRRYDFLALTSEKLIVVVEIKRQGHSISLDEVQRMNSYKEKLSRAKEKELHMMLVGGGNYDFTKEELDRWNRRDDCEITDWSKLHERANRHYEHYKAVLRNDVSNPDFTKKTEELNRTRKVMQNESVYRGADRKDGIGVQDVDYVGSDKSTND